MSGLKNILPSWPSAALAVLSALLLILAYPGFEWWPTAWFAFIPLLLAVEREKGSARRSFVTGWLFGVGFFFGTCWWLTFSPITYAGFPWPLAYFLLLCVCLIVGVFPAVFAAVLSILIKRIGLSAMLFAPFIWIATEFARFWMTGNNWNAIAYSQAFQGGVLIYAGFGGIYLVGFLVLLINLWLFFTVFIIINIYGYSIKTFVMGAAQKEGEVRFALVYIKDPFLAHVTRLLIPGWIVLLVILVAGASLLRRPDPPASVQTAYVIAIQPNVPMDGLSSAQYGELKRKHIISAEGAFAANLDKMAAARLDSYSTEQKFSTGLQVTKDTLTEQFQKNPKIVIFPESPMNFMYEDDKEFQEWVGAFAAKNNTSVLFNSAEPDPSNRKYFNSAVMVDAAGRKVAQYDKIYLMPFGEYVPAPLQSIVPALVGSFSYGKEYDLLPFGGAKGGIMICFESHFPNLSREYVRAGADVLVEMTNDGYLGPTPILRQHLANAVFRAVETNRPVLRVTNVGISAYIDEHGKVIDPTEGYTEDTRVWNVAVSDGSKTFYVKYGDWFAWVCSIFAVVLLVFAVGRRRKPQEQEG
jgi:apolipoprotein N-acyltransferase